ncbi:hypothetical protein PANT_6c00110 [Moesziomyces antarcticus T-34]|uniref:Arrestin C-terminal-like domain-containing protein n=1 Tax=Pseudozyma antarctica (strain T-34) TaxID=1151754 RepID=M9LYJ1_PSEA3|nr:hypothetical protein PANT_6c00110 [Moesziomyces antarcticus T-34]
MCALPTAGCSETGGAKPMPALKSCFRAAPLGVDRGAAVHTLASPEHLALRQTVRGPQTLPGIGDPTPGLLSLFTLHRPRQLSTSLPLGAAAMSGLGIDFGHESEAYSTDTGSRTSAATTSTSGFHSRTRAHMIPKKSSMNKMRGARPKTAEEDARRVRIVSGEPDILGHGAYTDEDFMSPPAHHDVVVQPHSLHSLSAAVAAMGGYSTDTATSSTETDSDTSPTLTESSVTSTSSGASSANQLNVRRKHLSQPPLGVHRHDDERGIRIMGAAQGASTAQQQPMPVVQRPVRESKSNTSLASGYRSDGGSSLGRTAEIPRGVGRNGGRGGHRASIRSAASRQGTLQNRLGPKVGANTAIEDADQTIRAEVPSDDETEVMVPDGFGGHTRTKQPRNPRPQTANAAVPSLLHRIDMSSDHAPSSNGPSRAEQYEVESSSRWKVGSFYAPDGSETARIDHETGTISERGTQLEPSEVALSRAQSRGGSESSATSLTRSHTSSIGPKASLMQSPSAQNAARSQEDAAEPSTEDGPVEGSTKAAAMLQNKQSRTSLASVAMRSKRGLQGLEEAERGGALVSLDNYRMTYDTGLPILPHEIRALDQDSIMGSVRLGQAPPMKTSLSHSGAPLTATASSASNVSETDHAASSASSKPRNRPRRSLSETNVNAALLERHGTLLSNTANPMRRSKELNRLLGNSDRKLPSSAARPMHLESPTKSGLKRSNAMPATVVPPPAALEQGKANKARVEVDLVLESDLVVEGGTLQGRMQIRVRKGSDKEGGVLLAQPKIRVVGFEELLSDDTRYIFYHHASVIDGDRSNNGPSEPYYLDGSPTLSSPETAPFSALSCFSGSPDAEGYAEGKVGSHSIPFSLELPVSKGAKGSYRGKNAVVRYIVIGSVKLKSASGANRSIAHFYRHVDLFPYLNPAVVLSSANKPIQASSSKGLFLGGSGKVHLMASLHRNTWVAGQRVYIQIGIQNDTSKKINGMTLALIRTVTLYKPRPELDLDGQAARRDLDPDACQTSTTRKKIAEEELEMGQKGSRGVVTARGWWTGVEPGQRVESSHYMHIPADALSISRGRHVEVVYSIKVSIGSSLSADVSVELPLRVINFVSLDPPPSKKAGAAKFSVDSARSWVSPGSSAGDARSPGSSSGRSTRDGAEDMVARLKSVDAMRSPGKTEISLANYDQHLQVARMLSPGEVAAEQKKLLQHQKSLDFINHAIRSAAARRGVDVTPTTSSSARTPSPAGLGIGVLDSSSASSARSGDSPGGSSSTDGVSGADEDYEEDNTKTPMASVNRSGTAQPIYPPGCEPYEPHHHRAHQAQYGGAYSQLPVTLHLPGGMHHMQQMQMQMYQMAPPPHAGGMLPVLRINNANAVSLDEIGDDYDDDDHDARADPDQTLGLNDESMAEMNMVIGSARLEDEDHAQFDDSMHVDDAEHDERQDMLFERVSRAADAGNEGWSLRRRDSADDEPEDADEADDVAEVSSIMQAVSLEPAAPPSSEVSVPGSMAPPTAAAVTTSVYNASQAAARMAVASPPVPVRGQSRATVTISPRTNAYAVSNVTRPLKISKESSATSSLLPQQTIHAKASSEQLAERSAGEVAVPSRDTQTLSAANLKRHSDNLSYRQQQQQPTRHRATHSVTGLKPLILKPKATSDGRRDRTSSAGSRTPDVASPREGAFVSGTGVAENVRTPDSLSSELSQIAPAPATAAKAIETKPSLMHKASDASIGSTSSPAAHSAGLPRSSTLQSMPMQTEGRMSVQRSESMSSVVDDAGDDRALSRSHSTHNLRGAAVLVPSVRNKIAMLESRSAALREFTGAAAEASPANSPLKKSTSISNFGLSSSTSTGRVAQLAASAERAGSLTPSASSPFRLGRKGSFVSVADSEDGAGSMVSSVAPVPEYMKTATSSIFHLGPSASRFSDP